MEWELLEWEEWCEEGEGRVYRRRRLFRHLRRLSQLLVRQVRVGLRRLLLGLLLVSRSRRRVQLRVQLRLWARHLHWWRRLRRHAILNDLHVLRDLLIALNIPETSDGDLSGLY